ncbi:MAG TPA: NAD(P)-dependent oxidoreductase [Bacillota bacterium]|nr:NAD(P)-dependent oxidoreductase [Bacillota bacterium]
MEGDRWAKTPMEELAGDRRTRSFDEVALGYTESEVLAEAQRCLNCLHPLCVDGCPNGNPIPAFIAAAAEGRILDAAQIDYENNPLPSCSGRVCAWERQCEGACVLNVCGEGVRIGAIERYIADAALSAGFAFAPAEDLDWRVAVVGAGPAGLSCADFLSRRGVAVAVLDAADQPGGLLADGIPEFVLPASRIQAEVARLRRQGVAFLPRVRLGADISLQRLREEFDAVFVAVGAGRARALGVPGEDAAGVVSAQRFLHEAKVSGGVPGVAGARVVVIGAGNTAMDAARTAVRLGAGDVRILYRRSEAESPSRPVEIAHARAEGVEFEYLVNPLAFLADDAGALTAVRLQRMRLGAPDRGGRPRPEPIPGSELDQPCDLAVLAVGYEVEGAAIAAPEAVRPDGRLAADAGDGRMELEGVFAGGDAVRGPATVVEAFRDGRVAADAILRYLATRGTSTQAAN